ncbi:MAG: membrane protein [Oligoflexia bacterium]|nr:MAG: membrane protein [Oligoflexia bacterium]
MLTAQIDVDALGKTLVSDIMSENPITVRASEDLETAAVLMAENNFHHLPVVDDNGDIQGIISDRDLLSVVIRVRPWKVRERAEGGWSKNRVSHVMTKTPETVSPDVTVREAGTVLLENRIGCLPVVDGNHLVGIITEYDFVKLVSQGLSANT